MKLLKPFLLISDIKALFAVHCLLILIMAHMGILFEYAFSTQDIMPYIESVLSRGILFNMAISLVSASLFPLFALNMTKEKGDFAAFRNLMIVVSFIAIILFSLLYSKTLSEKGNPTWQQILIYVPLLLFETYLFLVQFLDKGGKRYSNLSDENMHKISEAAHAVASDDRGTKF